MDGRLRASRRAPLRCRGAAPVRVLCRSGFARGRSLGVGPRQRLGLVEVRSGGGESRGPWEQFLGPIAGCKGNRDARTIPGLPGWPDRLSRRPMDSQVAPPPRAAPDRLRLVVRSARRCAHAPDLRLRIQRQTVACRWKNLPRTNRRERLSKRSGALNSLPFGPDPDRPDPEPHPPALPACDRPIAGTDPERDPEPDCPFP